MSPLRLAFLSISRRKVQSVLALLAIAISVACSGVLLRLYTLSGSRFSTIGRGGDAIVGAKAGGIEILLNSLNSEGEYPGFLPYVLFKTLRDQSAVHFEDGADSRPNYIERIIPVLFFAKFHDARVMGTDDTFYTRPFSEDTLTFASGRAPQFANEVVVGADIAHQNNLKLDDTIKVNPWIADTVSQNTIDLKIVGVLNPSSSNWDRTLYTTLGQAQGTLAQMDLGEKSIWGANVLNYFLVYLKPGGFKPLEALVNKRTVGQVIDVEKSKDALEELTGTGRKLGFFIVVFIILLGGLSVTAMLVTRFDAMAIQMAVLRAIGYSKREITAWLLFEGLILGFVACVIGGLLDLIFFPMIRMMLGSALPGPEILSVPIYVSAPVWLAAICATILAVVIPLARVYQQDVHYSLRGL